MRALGGPGSRSEGYIAAAVARHPGQKGEGFKEGGAADSTVLRISFGSALQKKVLTQLPAEVIFRGVDLLQAPKRHREVVRIIAMHGG